MRSECKSFSFACAITLMCSLHFAQSLLAEAADENWDAQFGVPGANATAGQIAILGHKTFFAGNFSSLAGPNGKWVASWDGTNWAPLGLGLNGFSFALAVSERELYAGDFAIAGGKPSKNIALWHIPHALSITRAENLLSLSWPATGTNFVLEAVETLGQTNRAGVPQPFAEVNNQCVVTNGIALSNRFYRLRRK